MKLKQAGSIQYYQFNSFENQGLYHAVFTRHGGSSPAPWKSLNFGATVGDDITRVQHNKEHALAAIGVKTDSIYDVYQVHSTEIVITDRALLPGEPHAKADAIITNTPGVTLVMRFADCVPILLYDPVNRVIGIAHAGWIGTINKIVEKTIVMMSQKYGCVTQHIQAAIGPSIGPDHYSVKLDVLEKVMTNFPGWYDQVITDHEGYYYFDLWKANKMILEMAGVSKIELAGICTQCSLEDWYSHRGEKGKTGRFGVALGISNL